VFEGTRMDSQKTSLVERFLPAEKESWYFYVTFGSIKLWASSPVIVKLCRYSKVLIKEG
jgi:hypothetical protein